MTLNELVKLAHETAIEKGWHEQERNPLEMHMLMVSEIAEASEEVRLGMPPLYCGVLGEFHKKVIPGVKPDGEAVELADCIIRIADYFGLMGWNLEEVITAKMEYNKTRPYRHGGKRY